jgi:hypothetical protein
MQSKGNQPNAEQKRWRERVRSLGCIACPATNGIEIHHPVGVGAGASFNKVHIGHYWVIPLCRECHELIGCPDDFSKERFRFTMVGRFDVEKMLFADVCEQFLAEDLPSNEVLESIWSYRR